MLAPALLIATRFFLTARELRGARDLVRAARAKVGQPAGP